MQFPPLKLFGHEASGHAYKVALALELAQIPHRYQRVDIEVPCADRPQEFRDNSRWCEVPCLIWDGQPMVQSAAILLRIAREFDVLGGRAKLDAAAEWLNWEANRIGMCVPQLIGAQAGGNAELMAARPWLLARYQLDAARLSQALIGQAFLLGADPTIADIAVYGYVSKLEKAGLTPSEEIRAWRARLEELPNYQNAETLLKR